MNEIELSVLMPVFNAKNKITATIDSILKQSYTNFELIIVDDGSIDGTAEIISQIKDNRVKLISIDHSGIVNALNIGFKYCKGKYIIRHDAEDLSHPKRFEILFNIMKQNENIDIVATKSFIFNEKYKIIGIYPLRKITNLNRIVDNNVSIICHPSVIMKKSCIENVNGYPSYKHIEDFVLWKKFRNLNYNFQYVNLPLYGIIKSNKGISFENSKKQFENVYKYIGVKKSDFEINELVIKKRIREKIMYNIDINNINISIFEYFYYSLLKVYDRLQRYRFSTYEHGFKDYEL